MTEPVLLAVVLAVLGAACFAGAAALQHRAVRAVARTARLRTAALGDLVARRGWLGGLALAVAGTALHGSALVLAPLSVVQPVGVLAVPMAVLLTGRRPPAGVPAAVAATVAGVALFVVLAAGSTVPGPVPAAAGALVAAVAAVPVAVLAALAASTSGRVRCVAAATGGAVAFGLVAALVRTLSQQLGAGVLGPTDAPVLATLAGIGVALALGGWLVQQGFAAGPPEVVVACLTVVDPIVAVLLGVLLLGEGAATAGGTAALLALAALVAAAGVLGLARHVPQADPAPDPRRDRPAPAPARPV